MTENKAVELLEYIRETGNGEAPYVGCAQNIAIDMAIQALEEIQSYRAIGTVEECSVAVERMKPKKAVAKGVMGFSGEEEYHCPNCNQKLMY